MDSPSKNVYEIFKDEIGKELGPLDPNWFELLTTQTSLNKGNISDQEDLCANQEGNFKTPLDKTAVESQLFSTPKVFRHSRVVSSEREDEQSFTTAQGTQSPCLFLVSKQGVHSAKYESIQAQNQECFGELKKNVSYAKYISESLGAQINPDISWTSSLNTPPAVPSTLILCDISQDTESHDPPQPSLNQNGNVQQLLKPDCVGNEETLGTLANLPDGAENTPCIFFANSSSTLRKVRPDRIRWKQINQTKENGSKPADTSVASNTASSGDEGIADQKSGCAVFSPGKTDTTGNTQWSPLSLSEIPPSVVDSKNVTEEIRSEPGFDQLIRPPVRITDSRFIRKKRTFIYNVGVTKSQAEEILPQKVNESSGVPNSGQEGNVELLRMAHDEATSSTGKNVLQEEKNIAGDNLPLCVKEKVYDLDMSQLCRDFAQDFSQMPDCDNTAQSHPPLLNESKGNENEYLADDDETILTNAQKSLVMERQALASIEEVDLESTSAQPQNGAEGNVSNCIPFSPQALGSLPQNMSLSLPSTNASGFKTSSNKGIQIPPANLERAKSLFEETNCERINLPTKCEHATKPKMCFSHGLVKGTDSGSNQQHSLSPGFVDTSGQLTASQKADVTELCTILEEADSQFEFTQFRTAKCIQHGKGDDTFPQKTDKELDSDFLTGVDFDDSFSLDAVNATRKKTSVCTNLPLSHTLKKEDSTTRDVPTSSEHISDDRRCLLSTESKSLHNSESSETSKLEKNDSLVPGVAAGGNLLRVSKACFSKAQALFLDLENQESPDTQIGEVDTKTDKCAMDFNSEKGSDQTGEKVHGSFTNKKETHSSDKLTSCVRENNVRFFAKHKMETTSCQSSFHMASGKMISISANYMRKADEFFRDCEDTLSVKPKRMKHVAEGKEKLLKCKTPQVMHVNDSETCLDGHTNGSHPDVEMNSVACNGTVELKNARSLHENQPLTSKSPLLCTTSKNIESSATDKLSSRDGFCTAIGKAVHVSADSMKKAQSLLKDIHGSEDTKKKTNKKEHALRTGELSAPIYISHRRSCGFQTASGKGLSISSEALMKAKSLFSECDGMVNEINVKPPNTNIAAPDPAPRNSELIPASGKQVSSEAPQKAKSVFSNITVCEEIPPRRGRDENHYLEGNANTTQCGFTAAQEEKADVSQKNLLLEFEDSFSAEMQELDAFIKDCDMHTNSEMLVEQKTIEPMSGSVSESKNLSDYKPDHRVTIVFSDQPGSGFTEVTNKQENSFPPPNCGFKMASGKRVTVSSEALKKSKTMLNDCEDNCEDKIGVTPSYFKNEIHDKPCGSGGFHTASGKQVALSSEALQKAKALFNDVGFSTDIPQTKIINNKDAYPEKMQWGFKTAGGAKVNVSEQNLLKVKHILKEFDDSALRKVMPEEETALLKDWETDANSGILVKQKVTTSRNRSDIKRKNLMNSKLDHGIDWLEQHGKEFTEVTNTPVKQDRHSFPLQNCGFKTASGKGVFVSSEALNKAQTLLSDSEGSEDKTYVTSQSKITFHGLPPGSGGFIAASGKKVVLSSESFQKAKALFSDVDFSADVYQTKISVKENPEKMHWGFTTARGANILVSDQNLLKARYLLKEFDDSVLTKTVQEESAFIKDRDTDANSEMSVKQKATASINRSDIKRKNFLNRKPDHRLTVDPFEQPEYEFSAVTKEQVKQHEEDSFPLQNCGLKTASGKGVAVSSDALKKAKTLSVCEVAEDKTCATSQSKVTVHGPSSGSGGFISASGKKMVISSESLQKAKALFSNIDFGADINQTKSSVKENDKDRNPEKMQLGLKTAGGANVCVSKQSLLKAKHLLKEFDDSPLRKDVQEGAVIGGCDVDRNNEKPVNHREDINAKNGIAPCMGSEIVRAEEANELNFQSFDLTGCTETQQMFFAQEALDCTKALLEDEGLASINFKVTSENVQLRNDPKSKNGTEEKEKRKRSAGDSDVTGQPPLKRRLLDELNRTIHGSTLHPVKSCPNGMMKDRRVFKYSTSLHPNITRPYRTGKVGETCFKKITQTQPPTPGGSRAAHSRILTFVPPFIKNKETQKNTVFKDSTRIPSGKTQVAADVSGLVDMTSTTNNDMMKNQCFPLGCGSFSPGKEATRVNGTSSGSRDVSQNLLNIKLAWDMQDMRIRKKKRQNIRPLPGSLFLTKTSGVARISLKTAVNGKRPGRYTQKQLYEYGVHWHVSEITSETAESFRFNMWQFIKQEAFTDEGGIQLADGGWLVPSEDGTAGREEFYRALCDTPGVDPKLISEAWVYNHYRWIVWKQASMEKSFPDTMGSHGLTPEQVLLQLKYRYDVEVDHSRRPALRKIMEKDDTAAKTLVLCVCGIISRGCSLNKQSLDGTTKTPQNAAAKVENESALIWLTDGWYAIKAQLDEPLTVILHKGRLAVGGKLIVHGAQLVGSQDACSPLEAPESLMLKICANSSRPVRWDAKLGFHKNPQPFLLPVSTLFNNGGPVGCVDVVILRSYPIQWMQRKPDGGVVFRSTRAEEKEARRFDEEKQKAMEIIYAKIQTEFEKEGKGSNKPQRRRRTVDHQAIASLQDGEELYEAVGDDLAYLEAQLSEQQLEALHTYRRSLMEKEQAHLQERYRRALEADDNEINCPKRDVTPVWRLSLGDSMDQSGRVYQLNLWRPSSDLQSLLKEGCRYKVYNLTTSDGRKRSGFEGVQLTGTKKTQFQELQVSQDWLSACFQQRVSTDLVKLQNPDFQPMCGEVDLTGYIIRILDRQGSSPAFYLADGEMNLVKVRCFSSLSQSGLEDVVKPYVCLALSNLQLRGQSMHPTAVVYAGDLTVFSTNPKEVHLQESLMQLKNKIQSKENFLLAVEEKLSHLLKSPSLSSISSPALQPQNTSTADVKQDTKTSTISQKPVSHLGSLTPVSRNPPTQASSVEKDPRSVKRKRALDYLSRILPPPPLPNLAFMASPCVNRTFNPPRRSVTPSTLKTPQAPTHKPVNLLEDDKWVNDEELAMIDTQALRVDLL
ncbi:breast cancer type 2 susceptibility protein [Pholidichthys leucotaenia]